MTVCGIFTFVFQADADVEELLTQDLSFADFIKEVTKFQKLAEEITFNCRKVRFQSAFFKAHNL